MRTACQRQEASLVDVMSDRLSRGAANSWPPHKRPMQQDEYRQGAIARLLRPETLASSL